MFSTGTQEFQIALPRWDDLAPAEFLRYPSHVFGAVLSHFTILLLGSVSGRASKNHDA